MLAAIRANLTASKPFDAVRSLRTATDEGQVGSQPSHSTDDARSHLVQHLASAATNQPVALVERFRESLEAVSGHCAVVGDEREAAAVVQQIIERTQARHLAISNSPLVERLMKGLKWDGDLLEGCEASTLFASDLGITGAQWGIAETGTLVLESDRERHRLVSLVPPVHIALIQSHQIRETLAEVFYTIHENGEEGLSRAVTLITGPSRTSDIELTLAIGVHGPAQLYVIVIEGELVKGE